MIVGIVYVCICEVNNDYECNNARTRTKRMSVLL